MIKKIHEKLFSKKHQIIGGIDQICPTNICGWVFSNTSKIVEVRLISKKQIIASCSVSKFRKDVSEKYLLEGNVGFELTLPDTCILDKSENYKVLALSADAESLQELSFFDKTKNTNASIKAIFDESYSGLLIQIHGINYDASLIEGYLSFAQFFDREITFWVHSDKLDSRKIHITQDQIQNIGKNKTKKFIIPIIQFEIFIGSRISFSYDSKNLLPIPQEESCIVPYPSEKEHKKEHIDKSDNIYVNKKNYPIDSFKFYSTKDLPYERQPSLAISSTRQGSQHSWYMNKTLLESVYDAWLEKNTITIEHPIRRILSIQQNMDTQLSSYKNNVSHYLNFLSAQGGYSLRSIVPEKLVSAQTLSININSSDLIFIDHLSLLKDVKYLCNAILMSPKDIPVFILIYDLENLNWIKQNLVKDDIEKIFCRVSLIFQKDYLYVLKDKIETTLEIVLDRKHCHPVEIENGLTPYLKDMSTAINRSLEYYLPKSIEIYDKNHKFEIIGLAYINNSTELTDLISYLIYLNHHKAEVHLYFEGNIENNINKIIEDISERRSLKIRVYKNKKHTKQLYLDHLKQLEDKTETLPLLSLKTDKKTSRNELSRDLLDHIISSKMSKGTNNPLYKTDDTNLLLFLPLDVNSYQHPKNNLNADISNYKNEHANEDIYVLCSGPSLDYIDKSFFEKKITIGINNVISHQICTYAIAKEYIATEWELNALKNCEATFVSLYQSGNCYTDTGNVGTSNFELYKSSSIIYFEHENNLLDEINTDILKSSKQLIVSWSTVTSAVHLALIMGAKNIVLVGHDCGLLDSHSSYAGYRKNTQSFDAWNGSQFEYAKWLSQIESQTIQVKKHLKSQNNVNLYSLNPFINFNLEGHHYERYKA